MDPTISLPSLSYERAGVVYNIAAVYSGLAAMENRDETEGIKRALTYLQVGPQPSRRRFTLNFELTFLTTSTQREH